MALMASAQPKSDPVLCCFMLAFFSYTAWLLWKETK